MRQGPSPVRSQREQREAVPGEGRKVLGVVRSQLRSGQHGGGGNQAVGSQAALSASEGAQRGRAFGNRLSRGSAISTFVSR